MGCVKKRKIEKEKIITLIPFKGITIAKNRLRREIGKELTELICKRLVNRILKIIVSLEMISQTFLLLKNRTEIETFIPEKLREKIRIINDQKTSLNGSITYFLKEKQKNKRNQEKKRVVIIMPDVPGLEKKIIVKFITTTPKEHIGIYPLKEEGTAMIIMNLEKHSAFRALFGEESHLKYRQLCQKENYSYKNDFRPKLIDIDNKETLLNWLQKEKITEDSLLKLRKTVLKKLKNK
ncbi:hypothetical protein EU523_01400 [Candidatus Heimdallarchaeota archaeon]|nr:MAG: hypothetical protein EU523_01400 [Candidatus Heimdallarchaeota archaeon]